MGNGTAKTRSALPSSQDTSALSEGDDDEDEEAIPFNQLHQRRDRDSQRKKNLRSTNGTASENQDSKLPPTTPRALHYEESEDMPEVACSPVARGRAESDQDEHDDQEQDSFLLLLDRIRDGTCNHADWELLCKKCTLDSMGKYSWTARGFDDPKAVRLFLTNDEVDTHNALCLQVLGKPIILCESVNSAGARRLDEDNFRGLKSAVHLAEDAEVMLTQNISAPLGLVNGTTGVVKDFVFADGVFAPSLPDYVWVDCGDQYKGATFFENNPERKGWVPIYPVVNTHKTSKGGTMLREGLPLRLSWALTVWKAQGQTIRGRLVVKLGDAEKSHGLTYTAFSRVTRLSDIGIIGGLTRERIMEKIENGKGMKIRIKEEKRLRLLAEKTEQELEGRV
jgi:hypothetical protein